jgi:hypothetical protein
VKLGRASYYVNRLQVWMGRANFVGILFLVSDRLGISLWLALAVVLVGGLVLAVLDSRYILEEENNANIMRSPIWVKFLKEWGEFYGRSR